MGKSPDEAMAEARAIGKNARVVITLVSNQDDGIATYAEGELRYAPGTTPSLVRLDSLRTIDPDGGLPYLFRDRIHLAGDPPPPGTFVLRPRQPFSVLAADRLGLSISPSSFFSPNWIVRFTLHSWGNATFTINAEPMGKLLVGQGPAIGRVASGALYVISFNEVFRWKPVP